MANVKKRAKEEYEASLDRLQSDPNNPALRTQTLKIGRHYIEIVKAQAHLTKDTSGIDTFDEMSLMNDINAACARSTEVAAARFNKPTSVASEIRKLTELLEEGILTADEWQSAKGQLVGKKSNQIDEAVTLLRSLHGLVIQGVLTESEYNIKKWDILSQRLMTPNRPPNPPPNKSSRARQAIIEESVGCPNCGKDILLNSVIVGNNTCPHCSQEFKAE